MTTPHNASGCWRKLLPFISLKLYVLSTKKSRIFHTLGCQKICFDKRNLAFGSRCVELARRECRKTGILRGKGPFLKQSIFAARSNHD
ncbi:hypothetical protein CLOSTMETH_01421 [[Clostridium] methylpentosum DSM 5476]|uniref:Uncharacterized protein n=1 Tax=[Clostridium] methylpentosum DSM 5476 TaxID=537013 RepID=C0EC52_9FIRM|nr:hypothetical protein CLOSTMETH_01421 [[Clostridium] methylpentosum DSM 5476]